MTVQLLVNVVWQYRDVHIKSLLNLHGYKCRTAKTMDCSDANMMLRKTSNPAQIQNAELKDMHFAQLTWLRTLESSSDATKVMANPLVPKRPARPTCHKQHNSSTDTETKFQLGQNWLQANEAWTQNHYGITCTADETRLHSTMEYLQDCKYNRLLLTLCRYVSAPLPCFASVSGMS